MTRFLYSSSEISLNEALSGNVKIHAPFEDFPPKHITFSLLLLADSTNCIIFKSTCTDKGIRYYHVTRTVSSPYIQHYEGLVQELNRKHYCWHIHVCNDKVMII